MQSVLEIDSEFKALMNALSEAEHAQLEANILSDGCRDPLVVWAGKNVLIDGHHRYDICTRHNVAFDIVEHAFDSREAVIVWIIENQLGRRNLPEPMRIKWALQLKPAIAAMNEARRNAGVKQDPRVNSREGRTDTEIAEKAGVGEQKIRHAETLLDLDGHLAFIREWYEAGDVTAHGGYQLYKALERAPEDVAAVVAKWGVTDYNTVPLMVGQYRRDSDTWAEMRDSGVIQPGDEDEAVSLTAGAKAVTEAIRLKSEYHKSAARDTRRATEDAAAGAAERATSREKEPGVWYATGTVLWLGGHLLICDDNRSENVRSILETVGASLAFCDPPYNAQVAEWDQGDFDWQQDFLADVADIVAVTPGIGNLHGFFQQTAMPYKWSVSAHISNGMTRGALGFGNWLYTALFSKSDSIHRNRQDITTIDIRMSDADELGAKRQKPSRYLAWLFGLLTDRGDTIIDAFGGSGNSVIVAHELGRRCICIERDEATFNAMVSRVAYAIGEDVHVKEVA